MKETKTQDSELFKGTSNQGDFHEALANAIAAAKVELRTDFISWTLYAVAGQNGGFIPVNDITVTIQAQGPSKNS